MAYGTRAERPTLRPQTKSNADRFLDRCELILTESLNLGTQSRLVQRSNLIA